VKLYRERMRLFAGMRTLDVWYAQDDADQLNALLQDKKIRRRTSRAMAKARSRDSLQVSGKLTHVVDGVRRIAADPPLITPIGDLAPGAEREELEQALRKLIGGYGRSLSTERRSLLERFRLVDLARKVVGVGSVGTRCWIVLMEGRDDGDPLLLQAKEAGESVLAPYSGPSRYDNQGKRVVAGQRLMQANSDIFLGWERVIGMDGRLRDFYVRQLRDWKGTPLPETMPPDMLRLYAGLCGGSLARAHARGRSGRPRRLPGNRQLLRPGPGGVRRGVRRPERAGVRSLRRGGEGRPDHRPGRLSMRPAKPLITLQG